MSVLIKGMEMPEECEVCPTRHFYTDTGKTVCMLTHATLAENYDTGIAFVRHKNCPLVELPEKHGKLIDADALTAEWKDVLSTDGISPMFAMVLGSAIRDVERAKVIVEAEGK